MKRIVAAFCAVLVAAVVALAFVWVTDPDHFVNPYRVAGPSCIKTHRPFALSGLLDGLRRVPLNKLDVPSEFMEAFFNDCTFETAEALLQKAGFEILRIDPARDKADREAGTQRFSAGHKILLLRLNGSDHAFFEIRLTKSGDIAVQGFLRKDFF